MEEGECISRPVFEILGEASASVEPGDGPLDNPSARQKDEAFGRIRPFDDLDFKFGEVFGNPFLEDRSLIGAVAEEFFQERIETEQGRHQQKTTIPVLNIRWMNDRMHQQALRIDEDMSFLAFDLLAGVIAIRINTDPPFSALFTLWLSMMQAVGLASRSSSSRHCTYKA